MGQRSRIMIAEALILAIASKSMPPPAVNRIIAMMHVAMFDAVNSIQRRCRP